MDKRFFKNKRNIFRLIIGMSAGLLLGAVLIYFGLGLGDSQEYIKPYSVKNIIAFGSVFAVYIIWVAWLGTYWEWKKSLVDPNANKTKEENIKLLLFTDTQVEAKGSIKIIARGSLAVLLCALIVWLVSSVLKRASVLEIVLAACAFLFIKVIEGVFVGKYDYDKFLLEIKNLDKKLKPKEPPVYIAAIIIANAAVWVAICIIACALDLAWWIVSSLVLLTNIISLIVYLVLRKKAPIEDSSPMEIQLEHSNEIVEQKSENNDAEQKSEDNAE